MGRYFLPAISGYDQFEVVSALRKTIKLGQKAEAIYWLNVLIENEQHKKAAKNLWIMAAEDIDEPMVVLRAFAVFMMVSKVAETDHQYYLVAAMCDAPKVDQNNPKSNEQRLLELVHAMAGAQKWWETHTGQEANQLWSQAIGDLKDPARRRPIPEVALDQHTRRGKALARRTGAMRDELSGTDKGQMKTLFQFLANGKLDEHLRVLDSEPGFRELYHRQQVAQGNRRPTPVPKPDEPEQEDLFSVPTEGTRQVGGPWEDEPPRRLGYWQGCENFREWC